MGVPEPVVQLGFPELVVEEVVGGGTYGAMVGKGAKVGKAVGAR